MLNKEQWNYETNRLNKIMEQISRNILMSIDKINSQRESLKEINKTMMSEFKFETESTIDLEGAAVMHQYQTMGLNVENAMNYQKQRKDELIKLSESTYFAKIVFKEDGEDEEEVYIGSSSLIEENGFEYLVYDWRAPICGIFYDYEKGNVSYEAPSGEINGELINKRHFKIFQGQIKYMFDSNINIMDDMLKEALAKSVDDKMKTIITTIQKEQNQVIRDESSDVLVVSGSAGSGKTSIALHRIAYLLYKNRDKIISSDILIFTPNDIFSDYISHVLPDLGEKNVDSITFNEYIQNNLGVYIPLKEDEQQSLFGETKEEGDKRPDPSENKILKCYWQEIESYYEQMEYLLSPNKDKSYHQRVESMTKKSSIEFFNAFEEYINGIELQTDLFNDLKFNNQVLLSKEEMMKSYLDCANVIKCSSRLMQVRQRMMEKIREKKRIVAKEHEKELLDGPDFYTQSDIQRKIYKHLKRHFKPLNRKVRLMTSLDLLKLYNNFLIQMELEPVALRLNFEDALCLMYMKGRLDNIKEVHKVKYLVIDEAQDYALLHYKIISLIFGHCKYTLLGDPNQAIHPYISSKVSGEIEDFLGKNPRHIRLTKTYRSTKQISDFCGKILPQTTDVENILRSGKEPLIVESLVSESPSLLLTNVQRSLDDGLQSVAIIGKTKEHCTSLFEQLKDSHISIGLINNEEQLYKTGVIIIPSYLAKGLEFDSVHVVSDKVYRYDEERERQLFYTVCTRALHELTIYYEDRQPKLLKAID